MHDCRQSEVPSAYNQLLTQSKQRSRYNHTCNLFNTVCVKFDHLLTQDWFRIIQYAILSYEFLANPKRPQAKKILLNSYLVM